MTLLPVFAASILLFATDVLAKDRCRAKVEECLRRGPTRPVCGTDGVTYPTRCHLLRTKCDSSPLLAVKFKGRCGEKRSCWEEEMRVSVGSEGGGGGGGGGPGVYTPRCLPDGSYAPLQCHNATNICWCSTPNGKPINSTVLRNQIPDCDRRGKLRKDAGSRRRKQRRDCGKQERTNFMRNLITMIHTEYSRAMDSNASAMMEEGGPITWKFKTLDLDKNESLSVNEYRGMRRIVKRVIKPKKCSRSFIRMCDADRDKLITKAEWMACLNKKSQAIPGDVIIAARPFIHNFGLPFSPSKEDDSEANDCLSDRKSALEEQKPNNLDSYVPECTPDGRFQKVQCFKSIGYCWCAYEDTGKPIPGTSRKDDLPNCSVTDTPSRPMKGMTKIPKAPRMPGLGPLEFLKEYD